LEAREEKRKIYQEAIKDITPRSLVYIDESGIDLTFAKLEVGVKKAKSLLVKRVVNITSESIL
jgi:hypothetical protein